MTRKLRQLAQLDGHTDRAWTVAWSPAEPLIASCSTDKSVRLYSYSPLIRAEHDQHPPRFRFTLQSTIPTSHSRTVRSLQFSPTGATLATASFDSTVGVWQRLNQAGLDDGPSTQDAPDADWEPADPLEGHESECKSVAWSSDGRLLASCSRDKSVWVWEAVGPTEFECLAVLMEHSQDVKSVTWHPTDELLASASYDDTVKLYAPDPYDDEWSCIETLQAHTGTVWSVTFSPCGNYLASAGDDLVIRIWGRDAQREGKDMGELGEAKREDGGRMGPWSRGGVRIGPGEKWKWSQKAQITEAHTRTIYSIDWSDGGLSSSERGLGRIATAGGDGRINVYQVTAPMNDTEMALQFQLVTREEDAHGVSDVNHVSWCRLSPTKAAARLRSLEGGDDSGDEDGAAALSLDDDPKWQGTRDMLASAGDDGIVRVWSVSE
ncbi:Cytosolic iron-sulfur protein assembly protein [Microbotryomycetes sp. JL201]|nr:Cytosolic iron-sulfur protein assembly protein [Microbotryomycetes sp. JL201]